MPGNLIPFGKYKGQPVEVLLADDNYRDWLLAQPWFSERFRDVYNVVINYGGEPQDTPEHNTMQAQFLDPTFCAAVAKSATLGELTWDREVFMDRCKEKAIGNISIFCDEPFVASHINFEENGWDVMFTVKGGVTIRDHYSYSDGCHHSTYLNRECIRKDCTSPKTKETYKTFYMNPVEPTYCVECKPTLGDDYPTVLRQIKNRPHRGWMILLIGSFTATGATIDQVKSIFKASKISLITTDEV